LLQADLTPRLFSICIYCEENNNGEHMVTIRICFHTAFIALETALYILYFTGQDLC